MKQELLRAAAGLGVFLLLLLGIALWSARPWTWTAGTPAADSSVPSPGDAFVGESIVPPKPAAEFDLVNRSGGRMTLKDLKGKLILLSFAYATCPDACPILYGRFLAVQKTFADRKDVALVFISVDPEADTPERLNQLTESMGGQWYFLTGEMSAVEKVWKDYRVFVEKKGIFVTHSNIVYLIDGNGLMRLRYIGIPPAQALISDIKGMLER
jgi:protein SCO1/2